MHNGAIQNRSLVIFDKFYSILNSVHLSQVLVPTCPKGLLCFEGILVLRIAQNDDEFLSKLDLIYLRGQGRGEFSTLLFLSILSMLQIYLSWFQTVFNGLLSHDFLQTINRQQSDPKNWTKMKGFNQILKGNDLQNVTLSFFVTNAHENLHESGH